MRCHVTVQNVTIPLPEEIYEQLRRVAASQSRPVDDLLVEAVIAAAPAVGTATAALRSALAQMTYLNDAVLWQAARATMPTDQRVRLADLHAEQQRRPLTADEQTEEQGLLDLYRGTVLVRAQAAAILKRRGYDVSDPAQFTPLE